MWTLILLICSIPVSGALWAETSLTGILGRAIIIHCHYEAQWYQSHIKYWCHGWTRQCNVLAATNWANGRISITDNKAQGIFLVTMKNLQWGEAGWYSCGIDAPGLDPLFNVQLHISEEAVSTPKLQFLSQPNVSCSGGSVTISCESARGSLPIHYTWYESSSQNSKISGTNKLDLHCQSFTQQHHQYYCTASNTQGTKSSEIVRVSVNNVTEKNCSYTVKINRIVSGALWAERSLTGILGRAIIIHCRYEAQRYQSHIKYWCHGWTRQCNVIAATNWANGRISITDNKAQGLFLVTMKNLQWGDAGWYSCGIDAPGLDPLFNVQLHISEEAVSTPKLQFLSQPNVSCSGGSVTISCESARGSLPILYTWYESSSQNSKISGTNKLDLHCQSFTQQHHQYYCTASNTQGTKSSEIVRVSVNNVTEKNCSYTVKISRIGQRYICDISSTISPTTAHSYDKNSESYVVWNVIRWMVFALLVICSVSVTKNVRKHVYEWRLQNLATELRPSYFHVFVLRYEPNPHHVFTISNCSLPPGKYTVQIPNMLFTAAYWQSPVIGSRGLPDSGSCIALYHRVQSWQLVTVGGTEQEGSGHLTLWHNAKLHLDEVIQLGHSHGVMTATTVALNFLANFQGPTGQLYGTSNSDTQMQTSCLCCRFLQIASVHMFPRAVTQILIFVNKTMWTLILLICSIPVSDALWAERSLTGILGRAITIHCHYEAQWYQSHIKYWCHGWTRQCNVIAATNWANGRISITDNKAQGIFLVTMKNLQWGDAGWYSCGIDAPGLDPMFYVQLHISEEAVSTPKLQFLSQPNVSCSEGSVTISCESARGSLPIHYTWYESSSQNSKISGTNKLDLHCQSFTQQHHQYYCTASNTQGTKSSEIVRVSVNNVTEKNCSYTVKIKSTVSDALWAERSLTGILGRAITIHCHYEAQWYQSHIKYWCHGWTRQCNVIAATNWANGRISITDNKAQGIFLVTMKNLQWGDAGWYSCGIDAPGLDPMFYVQLHISEEAVSTPKLQFLSQPNVSCSGGSVTISCESARGSLPIHYTWYESSSQNSKISGTNKLDLHCQSFTQQHHQYYCTASNTQGTKSSEIVHVSVNNVTEKNCSYTVKIKSTEQRYICNISSTIPPTTTYSPNANRISSPSQTPTSADNLSESLIYIVLGVLGAILVVFAVSLFLYLRQMDKGIFCIMHQQRDKTFNDDLELASVEKNMVYANINHIQTNTANRQRERRDNLKNDEIMYSALEFQKKSSSVRGGLARHTVDNSNSVIYSDLNLPNQPLKGNKKAPRLIPAQGSETAVYADIGI
ncbi:uncharacterized protein LOC132210796 [Stegostoma tigrinum]|uniref:uncharacterized protein LOC132210796 n=1 Tax=Stegostoma tigrinum TaxID=3053191 RepID=UPI0028708075|nr:uncharacterized protein LOC132210796 [Stegostoma tigrinum]